MALPPLAVWVGRGKYVIYLLCTGGVSSIPYHTNSKLSHACVPLKEMEENDSTQVTQRKSKRIKK
jgi:hypothetical protein